MWITTPPGGAANKGHRRHGMGSHRGLGWIRGLALAIAAGMFTALAQAEEGLVEVELNKLEPQDEGCLAYLVFENDSGHRFETFRLDLVMFDTEGIIAQRMALEAGPLAADKTIVKMFDITGLACDELGRVLLNEVMDCESGSGSIADCTARTHVTARTEVPFIK